MELLFPYLLCTLPIHTLFAQNSGEISVQDYIMSLFITILVISLVEWRIRIFATIF